MIIADQEAYLAASEALIDATLDVKLLQRAGVDRLPELRAAAAVMIDRYADTLAAQDQLIARGEAFRISDEVLGPLRDGRADMAAQAERAAVWLAQLDQAAGS